jgi:hypothetical protein
MSESHTFPPRDEPQPAPVSQWVGVFLAPAAFAAHLQISYVLVRWACLRSADVWVHVVDLSAIALAALSTIVAWRVWTRAGRAHPGEMGGALPRTRLLGVLGVGFGGMITLVLIGQWVASFFISTCQ